MAKLLHTPDSVWTKIFRALVAQIKADPDVARYIGVANVRSYSGAEGDKSPFQDSPDTPAVLRLTPSPEGVDWYSPDMQIGTLRVKVELAVFSLCIDDLIDLWSVVVRSVRPGATALDGVTPLPQALRALGAETGEVVFGDPAVAAQPDAMPESQFLGTGSFTLRVSVGVQD